MDPNTQRAEAERWLGIAAKLLTARDFLGSKTFAIRARESDPTNSVSDQILAVVETVLAGEKRVNSAQHPDWYTVLQLPRLVRDPDLIASHYRRLLLLLNPERNRLPFADYALQLVMDAWSVLSDANKKWLFDNELAVYLQRVEQPQQQQMLQQQQQQQGPIRVEAVRGVGVEFDMSSAAGADVVGSQGSGYVVAAAAAGNSDSIINNNNNNNLEINTFQFFQPQPPQQMWPQQHELQQQQQQQQHELQQQQQQHQQHQQQQHFQREFMTPPPPPPPQSQPMAQQQFQREFMSQQHQMLAPQWQMRDPTPVRSGERNKGVLNGLGGSRGGVAAAVASPSSTATAPTPMRAPNPTAIAAALPQAAAAVTVAAAPTTTRAMPPATRVAVAASVRTEAVDGNVGSLNVVHNISNDGRSSNVDVADGNSDNVAAAAAGSVGNENNDGVVEEVESFWTACPYCFYTYEYQKMYQDCTLRCQNCRKGFHAVQIPNPPPVSGRSSGKDKESFCCWGFFPLGFSLAAWKNQNRMGKSSALPNWVPFSPMFTSPVENPGGNFEWFNNNGAAGPKNFGKPPASTPRVYIDEDDEEAFLNDSDSSDSDSSDADWRNPVQGKRRKKRRGRAGRPRKSKTQDVDLESQENPNVVVGGGVSVGGEAVEDRPNTQNFVVGLTAGSKEDARKTVAATLTRNQARRRVKNMGRLDLNVEFNNEGDEHAPSASAVNGEEDGFENVTFFDGLDEFLSTLPILNVGGNEKAKPS